MPLASTQRMWQAQGQTEMGRQRGVTPREYARLVAAHARPCRRRALGQLISALAYFALCWAGIVWVLSVHPYAAAILVLPTAAGMIRLFVIQHDCGHRSFFRSRWANDWTGRAISVLTLMPYTSWRRTHDVHHATSGDLSRRGIGDVVTLTVREYQELSVSRRVAYRVYRNPLVLFGLGGLYLAATHRVPIGAPLERRELWISTQGTNVALLALWAGGAWLIGGVGTFLVFQLSVVFVYFVFGVWLFYVEHQFPATRWELAGGWDFHDTALYGSSFLDLPAPLRWFVGGIGVHHVHHLKTRIPNYRMDECLAAYPELRAINRLSMRDALASCRLALWNEESRELVSFASVQTPAADKPVTGGMPCRA